MRGEEEQRCDEPPARGMPGPYRGRPRADPAVRAEIDAALHEARREARHAGRTERRLTALAVIGYIVASMAVTSIGGERRAAVWVPVAAGATCALVGGCRAGSRSRDLDAEIEGLERLSARDRS